MSKKILIVDDSESIRELVSITLQDAGYEVFIAENGKDALKYFDGQKIDLVLTDLYMPVMTGLDLTEKIRQMPEYSKIPILILTTEQQKDMKSEAKKLGATGWIIKPFAPEKLIAAIKKVVR